MTRGSITKLVSSYGTKWGRITPDKEMREIFFDPRALDDPSIYEALFLGQQVDYEEEPERVNGSHATHVRTRLGAGGDGTT